MKANSTSTLLNTQCVCVSVYMHHYSLKTHMRTQIETRSNSFSLKLIEFQLKINIHKSSQLT